MALNDALIKLGSRKFPRVIDKIKNGQCRVLAFSGAAADDQGFPAEEYEPRIDDWLPCIWEAKSEGSAESAETTTAGKTQPFTRYRIALALKYDDEDVVVMQKDRIELREKVGTDPALTIEVEGAVNVSNVHWQVMAIDISS